MAFLTKLQIVVDNDVKVLHEKGAAYGDSWKKRGGIGSPGNGIGSRISVKTSSDMILFALVWRTRPPKECWNKSVISDGIWH